MERTITLLLVVSIVLLTFERIVIKTLVLLRFVECLSAVLIHPIKPEIRSIFIELQSLL